MDRLPPSTDVLGRLLFYSIYLRRQRHPNGDAQLVAQLVRHFRVPAAWAAQGELGARRDTVNISASASVGSGRKGSSALASARAWGWPGSRSTLQGNVAGPAVSAAGAVGVHSGAGVGEPPLEGMSLLEGGGPGGMTTLEGWIYLTQVRR